MLKCREWLPCYVAVSSVGMYEFLSARLSHQSDLLGTLNRFCKAFTPFDLDPNNYSADRSILMHLDRPRCQQRRGVIMYIFATFMLGMLKGRFERPNHNSHCVLRVDPGHWSTAV